MKKGFTLVELLAVIIILALLGLLTSTAIIKIVNKSKEDMYDAQTNLIIEAARTWASENIGLLPDENSCVYLTLKDLTDYGLLDSNIIDARTNEPLNPNLKIKISSRKNANEKIITDFEITDNTVGCTSIGS